jgi:hypothetical protein
MEYLDLFSKKRFLKYVIFGIIIFIFFYFRLAELNRIVWKDELITLKTLNVNPFFNPFYYTVSTNLPLYYYLLKLYEILTFNLLNLRFLNILVGFLTIYFVYKKYNFISKFQKIILILFLILSPLQIFYSLELRTYLLAQFLIVINYYFYVNKDFSKKFWLTVPFLLITHYACYLYLLAIFVYGIYKNFFTKKQVINFLICGLFGFFILLLIYISPGFSESARHSVLSGNFSRFEIGSIVENIFRIREVVTIYYNFGLHYYRLENFYLSLFKKFIQGLLLLYLIYIFLKFKNVRDLEIQNIVIFVLLMVFSVFMDFLGIIPFGGRHLFPFHFIYLLILSSVISKIYDFRNYLGVACLLFILFSYLMYNICLVKSITHFKGFGDPQGVLISKCIE